jgi:hypothetical protein
MIQPAGFHCVTPCLFVDDAAGLMSFLVNGLAVEPLRERLRRGHGVPITLGGTTGEPPEPKV